MAVAKQQLASIDISIRAPWITLNEQHIMACTSTELKNKKECHFMSDLLFVGYFCDSFQKSVLM
jgi:hypothetical protein